VSDAFYFYFSSAQNGNKHPPNVTPPRLTAMCHDVINMLRLHSVEGSLGSSVSRKIRKVTAN